MICPPNQNVTTLAGAALEALQHLPPSRPHLAITESSEEGLERFWKSVSKEPHEKGCWEWQGGKARRGYGRLSTRGGMVAAHRFSFWVHNKFLIDTLPICHRCDNPSCVNPEHLFQGTQLDNARDCLAKGRFIGQRQNCCKRGHPFTPENTIIKPKRPTQRECKTCQRMHEKKRDQKLRELKNEQRR